MKRSRSIVVFLFLCSVSFAAPVYAQQSSSTNYQVNEVFFGSGGELEACSGGQYCAKQSAGELTVGSTKSTNYKAQAGFNTDRTPWIEVSVQTPSVNMGVLDSSHPNIGTAQFYVKSYLSSGYVVQTVGTPPTYAGHTFTTPNTPATSSPGTEQFGMNLVANTAVTGAVDGTGTSMPNFGTDPVQHTDAGFPSDPFGLGDAYNSGSQVYDTTNQFKYTSGDIIASASSSSGYTYYTISYIFNISPVTPAGTYIMNQSLVATGTF